MKFIKIFEFLCGLSITGIIGIELLGIILDFKRKKIELDLQT